MIAGALQKSFRSISKYKSERDPLLQISELTDHFSTAAL